MSEKYIRVATTLYKIVCKPLCLFIFHNRSIAQIVRRSGRQTDVEAVRRILAEREKEIIKQSEKLPT